MLMKSSTKSSEVSNRGSSLSELGRHPGQGARELESKSCNVFAGLGQFDIVASIGNCWGSLFGAKRAFSKGCARVSVGTMVLAWQDAAGCHSKTPEDDGTGLVGVVVVVEPEDDVWDFGARRLPVL